MAATTYGFSAGETNACPPSRPSAAAAGSSAMWASSCVSAMRRCAAHNRVGRRASPRSQVGLLGEDDALDRVAGARDQLRHGGLALVKAREHVRGDDLRIAGVGAPHADAHACEAGAAE